MKKKMKNKLHIIGYMGCKSCYLNISKEEAVKRYNIDNIDNRDSLEIPIDLDDVKTIEFEDEFEAYDVWGKP